MIHFIRQLRTQEEIELALVHLGQAVTMLEEAFRTDPTQFRQATVLDADANNNIPAELALSRIGQEACRLGDSIRNSRARLGVVRPYGQ
jgi:hypothetical protein